VSSSHPVEDRSGEPPEQAVTPESPYAAQLARGFPWLRFEPSLEREFRQVHHGRVAVEVRRNLWLAVVFVTSFSALGYVLGPPLHADGVGLMHLLPFLPFLAVVLVMVYTPLYRFYPVAAQVGAPLFGAMVVLLEVQAALHGAGMLSTVVIATFYIYLMLGLRFYPALRSALPLQMVHLVATLAAGLSWSYLLISSVLLAFANIIGAIVCYRLEFASRTNFLEARLLTEVANRDGLTGIYNRRLFDEHMDRVWHQAARNRTELALLLIDIDHFKAYNDHYGHQAGDECLKKVAACLAAVARRPLDIAARYGGEEFAVVLYDADRNHVEQTARRIQREIEALGLEHAASSIAGGRVTVSIGAACIEPNVARTRFGFIQLADEALYEAKELGRNRLVVMDKEYARMSTGAFRRTAEAS